MPGRGRGVWCSKACVPPRAALPAKPSRQGCTPKVSPAYDEAIDALGPAFGPENRRSSGAALAVSYGGGGGGGGDASPANRPDHRLRGVPQLGPGKLVDDPAIADPILRCGARIPSSAPAHQPRPNLTSQRFSDRECDEARPFLAANSKVVRCPG